MWNSTGPDSNRDPPPGVTPNYDNPTDVNWTANIAVMAVCDVLVTLFFLIRVYVKSTINRKILVEDWTCAVAYVLVILYTVTIYLMAYNGAGYHSWDVPLAEYYEMLKWLYASTVVYCPASFFTKATLLLLMARVFAVENMVSRGIHIFIWCLLAAYTPILIIWSAVCIPIQTLWDPNVENPYCLNQRKVFFSSLSLSILTDIIILMVPIPLTWALRMPVRKKMKIVLLLSAGGAATALTIYRTIKAVRFLDSDDITVDFVIIGILTCLEITIGFVCACLPSLNLLFEHHFHRRGRESPNQPRTREMYTDTAKRSILHWGSTARETESSSRQGSDPAQSGENQNPNPAVDFDVELAMLTGQPVQLAARPSESLESTEPRLVGTRIDSRGGREEGWLADDRKSFEKSQGAEFIMKMVERSRMLSDGGAEESRCPVWDGPREHMRV